MNYSQFMSAKENLSPVYVLSGDAFLANNVIANIKSRLNIIDNASVSIFDSENFSARSIINACEQMSFFDCNRLVIVKNITSNISESEKDILLLYIKNPNPICTLLFVDTAGTSVFDFLKVEKILCNVQYESELYDLVKTRCKNNNCTIESDAIKSLVENSQKNVLFLISEVDKLCAYKLKQKNITKKDIDEIATKSEEVVVFELTTALSTKNTDKAIYLLKKLMGSPDQNSKLFALISSNFRRMFFASISKQDNATLAKQFGVKEFAIVKAKEQAKNFSPKKLKNICELLSDIDYYSKSGQMSQENALYFLCFSILYTK